MNGDENEWEDEQPHTIIVKRVGNPYGPLSTHDFEEYEVDHTGCPVEPCNFFEEDGTVPTCAVGREQSENGLRWALHYSGTPIMEPGTYKVRAWGRKRYYPSVGAWEYDGGVYCEEAVS